MGRRMGCRVIDVVAQNAPLHFRDFFLVPKSVGSLFFLDGGHTYHHHIQEFI